MPLSRSAASRRIEMNTDAVMVTPLEKKKNCEMTSDDLRSMPLPSAKALNSSPSSTSTAAMMT